MAIYKCSECGASISEYANACPRCGALGSGERSKKIANSGGGLVGVFVVGAIAFGAYYFATNKRSDSSFDSGYPPSRSASTEQTENVAVGNEQSQTASEAVEESNASSSSEVASEAVYVCCYGAFSGEEEAESVATRLRNDGYDAYKLWIPEFNSLSGAQMYLVHIGRYANRSECQEKLSQLRSELSPDMYGARVANDGESDYIR